MKVATWNVNSIRSRLERLLRWLDKVRPDVVRHLGEHVESISIYYRRRLQRRSRFPAGRLE